MSEYTFYVAVTLPGSPQQQVAIQAPNAIQARKLAEAQYGKSAVRGVRGPIK